ncbi:MAG: hypothetical protein Q8O67_33420 [Deltaproteobacteria bacterium]|nr:hypothetical protein [Deltaproteobacteria bacterium]
MSALLLALLVVTQAEVVEPPAPRRVVTLMPFVAGTAVTAKQARGVSAQLRGVVEALDQAAVLRLLPLTKDDDTALRKCGADDGCFRDLAQLRGADLLVRGTVAAGEGGLTLSAQVLPAGATFTATLRGDDDDGPALDRLARELCAPDTLRGTLRVEGQPDDEVTLDGRRRGTIGNDEDKSFTITKLREGEHALQVSRPVSKNGVAYEPFTRAVNVRHAETTTVKVTLLPRATTDQLGEQPGTDASSSSSLAPLLTVGAGAVLAGVGVTFGVLSLLDSIDVEERAERQQLVFPRDQELVSRGATFSVVANVFYGVGAATAGAGVAWWVLSMPPESP